MRKIIYSSVENKLTSFKQVYENFSALTKTGRIFWDYLFYGRPNEFNEESVREKIACSSSAYFCALRELTCKRYLVPINLDTNEWLFVPFPNSTN